MGEDEEGGGACERGCEGGLVVVGHCDDGGEAQGSRGEGARGFEENHGGWMDDNRGFGLGEVRDRRGV